MRLGRWPIPERVQRIVKREIDFFRDAPLISPTPEKNIEVLVGAGQHLYVQAVHWPSRSRQEQELETANMLLRAAQMMAVSAGAMLVQNGQPAAPPQGGPPNG